MAFPKEKEIVEICPIELLKESDVVLTEQMAEDPRAGNPSQAVNTGRAGRAIPRLTNTCLCFQRGRIEDVVVSGECRGKQLGKL